MPYKTSLFVFLCFLFSTPLMGQLMPDFTVDFTEICAPGVVQLSDNSVSSGNTIVQWEWKRNGVIFSNLPNPGLFLNNPGQYDICLTVTDNLGNTDSLCINNYITAYQSPTANFNVNTTSGCSPLVVNFSDLSTLGDAPIQQWRWDFGDGFIDTSNQNPTHIYTTIGTFDVTLVVIDTNGCSNSILMSNLITVSNNVTAAIIHNSYQAQCGLPASVTFTGIGNGPGLSYSWLFDDGTTGSGASVTHNYLAQGCYSPTVVISNGLCSASATVASCITISDAPVANFTISDSTNCSIPFTTSFTNQSTGLTSFSWDFGDGTTSNTYSPNHTYTSYTPQDSSNNPHGVFPIVLNTSNAIGCMDSDTQYVYISNLIASISPQNLPCAPDSAYYQASSINISSYFESIGWVWTLDNFGSSTGAYATAYYPDSGIYNTQVIVTDNIGCTDTVNNFIEVGINPTIDSITTDTNFICRITTIDFQGYGSSYIDSWFWTFSDFSSGNTSFFSHNFQDTGWITGSVVARFRGCIDTMDLDSYYVYPPIAKFSPVIICDSLKVRFEDESIGAHRWFWDFGDSTTTLDTSTLRNPCYIYSNPGTYIVILTVYNDSTNCIDSFKNVVIMSIPIADFSIPDSICTIANVTPINNSQDASSYQWTAFGSTPFTNNSPEPLLAYKRAGIFPITLTAFSDNGCFDTLRQYIHIAGIDTNITHSPIPVCRPALVNFRDSSIGILSPIINWQWGNLSMSPTTNQQYVFPGIDIMTLQVTNDWGCTFNLIDSVYVGGLFINFSTTRDVCLGNSMTAVAITNSPANANAFRPYTYIWDFGDGNRDTTTSSIFYHTYTSAGLFDVCLDIIDSLGCVTTLCRPDWVEVHDPASLFTADTFYSSCPPLEVNFSNLSLSGSQWSWSFGDGSVSNLENPTHVYSTSGFYDVILEVVAFPGCSNVDTIQQMIQITGPNGNFTMPPTNNCAPFTAEFAGTGSNIATYTWLFGNGDFQINNNNSNNDTTYYTYTQPGAYVPSLVLDDGMGCQIPIEQDTIFIFAPPSPAFSSDSLICQMDSISYQLLTATNSNTSIEWFFEGGFPNNSTVSNPTIYYPDTGSFDVQLIIWEDGCSDTLLRPNLIQIKALPVANFARTIVDTCTPVLVQFSDSSTNQQGPIQFWSWDFGNGQYANNQDSTLWYNQVGTFTVQLIVENSFGCKDTIQQLLQTYPVPTVDAGAYPMPCTGDTIQLQGSGNAILNWSSATWISNTNLANPLTVIDSSNQYILSSTNSFGCQVSDTIEIIPIPLILVDAGDSVVICSGDSITLQATGNTTAYDWGIHSSLSCQFCATPIASPNNTTIYYLQTSLVSNCANKDSVVVVVNPLPIATITNDSSICEGDTLQLVASGGQNYQWFTNSNLSNDSIFNPTSIPLTTATYTVFVVDSNQCRDSIHTVVNIRSTAFLPIPDQTICLGDSVVLMLNSGSNPTWLGTFLSCNNCLQTTAQPIDSSHYYVHYYNDENCLVHDSLEIQVLDLRQLLASSSDTICSGDTLQISVSGNANAPITWTPNYAISSINALSPLIYPTIDTHYTVQITQGMCHAQDSIFIRLRPSTAISTNDIAYCLGDSAQLITTGNALNYQWNPNIYLSNSNLPSPFVQAINNQQYQVIGNGFCNNDTAYAMVQVHPYPNVQLDSSITAVLGTTITLQASSNNNPVFSWSPSLDLSCNNCPNPSWLVSGNQTFYVTVTNTFGCPVSDSIVVRFLSDCTPDLIFVPNAFTPDEDGHNDRLYVQSGSIQEILSFQIYNRWGQLIFETNDISNGWDGRFQGAQLPPDVFGYFVLFRCPNTGEEILKKGNVTILR